MSAGNLWKANCWSLLATIGHNFQDIVTKWSETHSQISTHCWPWQCLVTTWQQRVTPSNLPVTYGNYLVTSGNILVMPNNSLFCFIIFCSQIFIVCDTRQLLVTTGNNLALLAIAGHIWQQGGHIWQQVVVNTRYFNAKRLFLGCVIPHLAESRNQGNTL